MQLNPKIDEIIAEYRALSSPIISDAMDAAGLHGTVDGLSTQVPGKKLCGPAFTARYTKAENALARFADFLDDIPAGHVAAIDNDGRMDVSVWGDTLSLFSARNGIEGAVIDGVCRDIEGTQEVGLPMFSRGVFMRTGKGRVGVESTQQPIKLGPIVVYPGDLIFGDDTGVVVVPHDKLEEVLQNARKIVRRDDVCEAAIRNGKPMTEVWKAGAQAN